MQSTLVLSLLCAALSANADAQQAFPLNAVTWLEQRGVSTALDFSTDVFGGRTNAGSPITSQQWLDLAASYDLAHLSASFSHARVFFSLHANGAIRTGFSDPLQSVSGIQSAPGVHLAEAWLQHTVSSGLQVRLGKIDANRDFALVENGLLFLNSSAGYDPTFVTLPNYNDSRPGAELLLDRRSLTIKVAAFAPVSGNGAILMQEVEKRWMLGGLSSRFALGAWEMTASMPALNDDEHGGAHGEYLVLEQTFWQHPRSQPGLPRSLGVFLQIGASPELFSCVDRHGTIGLLWKGPLRRRSGDAIGLSFSRGRLSLFESTSSSSETGYEVFYRIQVSRMSFTPDVQYITHPSQLDSGRATLAAGIRMSFSLGTPSE
jgi:carbohydrate-selective porin OprB